MHVASFSDLCVPKTPSGLVDRRIGLVGAMIDPAEPKFRQIEFVDNDIDYANPIVLTDPAFHAFRNSVLCTRSVPSTKRLIRSPANRVRSISQESNPASRHIAPTHVDNPDSLSSLAKLENAGSAPGLSTAAPYDALLLRKDVVAPREDGRAELRQERDRCLFAHLGRIRIEIGPECSHVDVKCGALDMRNLKSPGSRRPPSPSNR
jgi:hypothetical protein